MIKTTIICDRCGSEGGGTWETGVIEFTFRLPADGVNGGHFKMDLCRGCRETFWIHVKAFRENPPQTK